MLIAVPSKGRAGLTTTNKIIPNLSTFFIPESEYHQYKGIVKNIVCVPKEIKGITDTRNWILQNTDEKWVVFLDDDAKNVGYNKLEERKTRNIQIKNEDFWAEEFLGFFDLTMQLGYKIWGVRTESSARGTHPYKPFLTRSYVTASCMGIVNDGEYMFNPDFKVKEDYEICLRHIKDKGGILAVRYLHWQNEHWTTDGGCKDYRTIDMERDAIKKLIKLYPNMISLAKRKANEFTIKLNL